MATKIINNLSFQELKEVIQWKVFSEDETKLYGRPSTYYADDALRKAKKSIPSQKLTVVGITEDGETETQLTFTPNIKLAIFDGGLYCAFGKLVYAESVEDLLENKMSKKDRENWELIKYRDEDGGVMCIHREFMDEGMSLEDVKDDWTTYGQKDNPDDDIACFPRTRQFPIEPIRF